MSGKLMLKGAHGVDTNSLTVSPPRAPGHLSQGWEGLGATTQGVPRCLHTFPALVPGLCVSPGL